MVVEQGEVYWVDFGTKHGSKPAFRRPCLVLQNDYFNCSAIKTVIVLALSSNIDLARAKGNVLLKSGEAGLSKQSVVNASQAYTVNKADLNQRIGKVSQVRLKEIIHGFNQLIAMT